VDRDEARAVLARELAPLRGLSHDALVERLCGRIEVREVVGPSGTVYQIELEGLWDHPGRPGEVLRVLGGIDDGHLRSAFRPVTDGFLVAPDGTFVGE
jgi:hypothetical protein